MSGSAFSSVKQQCSADDRNRKIFNQIGRNQDFSKYKLSILSRIFIKVRQNCLFFWPLLGLHVAAVLERRKNKWNSWNFYPTDQWSHFNLSWTIIDFLEYTVMFHVSTLNKYLRSNGFNLLFTYLVAFWHRGFKLLHS